MAHSSRLRRALLALLLALVATAVVLVGAARSRNASLAVLHRDAAQLNVSAPQFAQARIPDEFSCKGAGHSPAISWSQAPPHSASFVVLLRDQDVPHPYFPIASVDHWLLYNIAPTITSIDANVTVKSLLDQHIESAMNPALSGPTGYIAPCPPMGRHAYVISVYALDIAHLDKNDDAEATLEMMKGHVIGYGAVTGTLS